MIMCIIVANHEQLVWYLKVACQLRLRCDCAVMNIIESQDRRSAVAIENGSAIALHVRRDNFASRMHAAQSQLASLLVGACNCSLYETGSDIKNPDIKNPDIKNTDITHCDTSQLSIETQKKGLRTTP
jgi:hypothetical protein